MGISDILILAGVAAILAGAILHIRKNRKQGKCSCGCGSCNGGCGRKQS